MRTTLVRKPNHPLSKIRQGELENLRQERKKKVVEKKEAYQILGFSKSYWAMPHDLQHFTANPLFPLITNSLYNFFFLAF